MLDELRVKTLTTVCLVSSVVPTTPRYAIVLNVRGEKSDLNGYCEGPGPITSCAAADVYMGVRVPTYHSFSPHAPPMAVTFLAAAAGGNACRR